MRFRYILLAMAALAIGLMPAAERTAFVRLLLPLHAQLCSVIPNACAPVGPSLDHWVHGGVFFLLSLTLFPSRIPFLTVLVATIPAAIVAELLQFFAKGRFVSADDIVANLVGVSIGLAVRETYRLYKRVGNNRA